MEQLQQQDSELQKEKQQLQQVGLTCWHRGHSTNVTHRGCGISRVVYLQGCQHTHCIPRGHCWLPVFSCAGQGVCRRQRHVGERVWCFQSKPLTNLQQHS